MTDPTPDFPILRDPDPFDLGDPFVLTPEQARELMVEMADDYGVDADWGWEE